MPANRVAENVLGTIGAVCWTVQLIPQIWKSWRSKSTDGLSLWLVWLWGISGPFLGVYAVVQKLNVPLIVQPHLFATLCFVSWAQCLCYGKKQSRTLAIVSFMVMITVIGGFEAGMIFAIRHAYDSGNTAPVQFFGIMSSVIISLALLPQYYEIYKYKEVVGISTTFMLVDCLGGVFSDLSLAFKDKFDVIAAITYSLVVFLDGIVLILALILNPRAERHRKKLVEAETLVALNPTTDETYIPTASDSTNAALDGKKDSIGSKTGARDVEQDVSCCVEKPMDSTNEVMITTQV